MTLGISHQLDENYSSSINALEQAISLDPNFYSSYNSIGLNYKKMGKFHKAIEWYSKATDRIVYAITDQVTKDKEKCYKKEIIDGKETLVMLPYMLDKMHELLTANPIYSVINNNIGVCMIDLGDTDSARGYFNESIKCIPDGYNYSDPFKNLESIS